MPAAFILKLEILGGRSFEGAFIRGGVHSRGRSFEGGRLFEEIW